MVLDVLGLLPCQLHAYTQTLRTTVIRHVQLCLTAMLQSGKSWLINPVLQLAQHTNMLF